MIHRFLILLSVLLSYATITKAQDSCRTEITCDLSTEAAVGSGDFTAYQLVTNRHHVLSTRSNTAYLRGAVNIRHAFTDNLSLSGCVDAIGSIHADHKFYLQQCYANLSFKKFFLEFGAREHAAVVRNDLLSIGSFTKGTNAKPFAQLHIGTNGFWDVPFTRKWIQVDFDGGYGRFLDGNYREDAFYRGETPNGNLNSYYATGIYMHQKHLYIRTNPEKRFFAMVGIEHMAQFGGTKYMYVRNADGTLSLQSKSKSVGLKDIWGVFLCRGDQNYFENNAMEDWVYGNHVGVMTAQIGWNINSGHQLKAYLDNPFEDGSGIRKGNGWDGLWGLEYKNQSEGRQFVRGVVAEYFQSTNQSGPLHWDSNDYPEPARSQITDFVVGADNYYNHSFYNSYTHYGMTPGIALITSPIYNKDGFTQFRDNRVRAWHLGVNGEVTERLSYLVKGSYREGKGTYFMPLPQKQHSLDVMIQGNYSLGPWQFSAAFAFDKGNIYGDCYTFNIKIGYHGKIL